MTHIWRQEALSPPTPILEHPTPRYRWVGVCVRRCKISEVSAAREPERSVKFLFVGGWKVARIEKIGHKHASFPCLDTQFIWDPISEEASKHERKDIEGIAHIIIRIDQHMQNFSSLDYHARVRKKLSPQCPSPAVSNRNSSSQANQKSPATIPSQGTTKIRDQIYV